MTLHEPNERDPLLQAENGRSSHAPSKIPGPLEISKSTRHGILAGIWVATFLTVSHTSPLLISSYTLLLGY